MKDLCFTTISPEIMVMAEHERQIKKWGIQEHDAFQWLGFATEELGEIAKAISENYYRNGKASDVVKESIQCATLCLKIAEMFN